MPVSLENTVIRFNDNTTQSTAASAYVGPTAGAIYTSSGSFTVPSGITKLRVGIKGGGGGGGGLSQGSNGGSTSFGGLVAGGYGGGGGRLICYSGNEGCGFSNAGNNANGGSTNIPFLAESFAPINYSTLGRGGNGGTASSGCCTYPQTGNQGSDGSSGVGYLTGLTPGSSISITIGGGGAGGGNGAAAGASGYVVIDW